MPDIPSLDEAGLTGFDISVWNALWAPRGTPKEIIAQLNAAVLSSLADPGVRERLAELGQEIPPRDQQTPAALAAYQKAEIEKWWPIMKAAGRIVARLANVPRCLIGIEAGMATHYVARDLTALGGGLPWAKA